MSYTLFFFISQLLHHNTVDFALWHTLAFEVDVRIAKDVADGGIGGGDVEGGIVAGEDLLDLIDGIPACIF